MNSDLDAIGVNGDNHRTATAGLIGFAALSTYGVLAVAMHDAAEIGDLMNISLGPSVGYPYLLGMGYNPAEITAVKNSIGYAVENGRSGLDGTDTLIGGDGLDTLTGGAGADKFQFGAALAANADRITDFAVGVDKLVFTAATYGLAAGALAAANFTAGAAAVGGAAQFIYNSAAKTLSWDGDGNGAGLAVLVANFDSAIALTNADFVLI